MQPISFKTRKDSSAGFTLVEMLVVAPLLILVITGFIALIVTLTGEVLFTSARNKLSHSTNQTLAMVERDIRGSVLFPSTSFTPLAPQGYNLATNTTTGGSAISTSYNTMIFRRIATDKNPLNPTRNIVYKANSPHACNSPLVDQNEPYEYDVVYYYTGGPLAGDAYHWWRRVLFDNPTSSTPCTTPWQQPSCSPGQTGAICKATDQEWGSGIYGVDWYYADIPDSTTPTFQDWIHPYNDGTPSCNTDYPGAPEPVIGTCANHHFNPYSPTTGKNAKSMYILLGTTTTVAGRATAVYTTLYATRVNGPQ